MGGIYFFIVLIVFFVVYEVESFRYRSSTKDKIKNSFGKIPQSREFDLHQSIYYQFDFGPKHKYLLSKIHVFTSLNGNDFNGCTR